MEINIWAVIIATIAQFIVGAVWYSLLFGKFWGQIHGFDKLSKDVQKEMMSKMVPYYGLQLIMTIVTSVVFAKLWTYMPDKSPYVLAALFWGGFIVPTQVSAVIFGGTEPKWIAKKIIVMAGAALACLMAAALVFSLFK